MIKIFIRASITVKIFIGYRKFLWFNIKMKKLDIFLKI